MSRWRGVALRIVLFVAALEATSFGALLLIKRSSTTYADLGAARQRQVAAGGAVHPQDAQSSTLTVPHPFSGFVLDPRFDPQGTRANFHMPVSDWGYVDDQPAIQRAAPDTLIVGVFGGSVAMWVSLDGVDTLKEVLASAHAFHGKRLVVVRTALPGFKQPQQLATLAYLLSVGAHFDVVINLDGFNEVALPSSTNIPEGEFPFFPTNWARLVGSSGGPRRLRTIGELTYLQSRRAQRADLFSRWWLRRSATASLLWVLLDRRAAGEFDRVQALLDAQPAASASVPYMVSGPSRTYANESEVFQDSADVWMRSSLAMAQLCQAQGIAYFHFLQPNQYRPGSKPIGPAEAAVAFYPGTAYERAVLGGYPKLLAHGRELVARGVDFTDLTQVFAEINEPLYTDNCCHVNRKGSSVMARRIGDRVRRAVDQRPPAR